MRGILAAVLAVCIAFAIAVQVTHTGHRISLVKTAVGSLRFFNPARPAPSDCALRPRRSA